MMRNTRLAYSISDAAWGEFTKMLRYKAERAGAKLVEVKARNTSQLCSGCGEIVPKKLSVRMHNCPHCGLVLDRDHNAALNILRRGVVAPGFANVA
jgi:putative transposase